MNKIVFFVLFILPVNLLAQDIHDVKTDTKDEMRTVSSPQHRVVMLELYTSEGCSSCPPADQFLSKLKAMGVNDKQIIPLAFHVTYWDYIGWKDRFANKQFDDRQRRLASKNKQKTIYTPQFVFSGDDYREYASFSEDVNALVSQEAAVNLVLTGQVLTDGVHADKLHLTLKSDISKSKINDVELYFVVTENNLSSDVSHGENQGETLHHDYVVRQISGPYFHSKTDNQVERAFTVVLHPEWKKQDLSIIAFAENPHTGEILQAVSFDY